MQEGTDKGSNEDKGFHDEDEVPVNKGSIGQGVAASKVEEEPGHAASKDRHGRESNGFAERQAHDENVGRHHNASSPNATARRQRDTQRSHEETKDIVRRQRKQLQLRIFLKSLVIIVNVHGSIVLHVVAPVVAVVVVVVVVLGIFIVVLFLLFVLFFFLIFFLLLLLLLLLFLFCYCSICDKVVVVIIPNPRINKTRLSGSLLPGSNKDTGCTVSGGRSSTTKATTTAKATTTTNANLVLI